MNSCRYIPNRALPKVAAKEHVSAIQNAIRTRQIRVMGKAANMLECLWKMRTPAFVHAVDSHIQSGHRIFEKMVQDPPPNQMLFQANVRLDPDSDSEDDDIYVEIRLCNGMFVLICNSHPHFDSCRLPK